MFLTLNNLEELQKLIGPLVYRPPGWSKVSNPILVIDDPNDGINLEELVGEDEECVYMRDDRGNVQLLSYDESAGIVQQVPYYVPTPSEHENAGCRGAPSADTFIWAYFLTPTPFMGEPEDMAREIGGAADLGLLWFVHSLTDLGSIGAPSQYYTPTLPVVCKECGGKGAVESTPFGICPKCEGTGALSWPRYQQLFAWTSKMLDPWGDD